MEKDKQHKTRRSEYFAARNVNLKKAAQLTIVTGWLQIIVAVVLVALYFTHQQDFTLIFIILLLPVIIFGNALLMRSAWQVFSFRDEVMQMRETLDNVTQFNLSLRAQRHDFMNHLQVVYSLLQLKEYDEAEEYMQTVYQDLKHIDPMVRTPNPAVNGLLSAKAQKAQNSGIHFYTNISSRLEGLPFEDWELCRILGNLLDNAIDAAMEQPLDVQPWVAVSIAEETSFITIVISNSGEPVPDEVRDSLFEPGVTTKGSRGNGMGLYIVRSILEENGGAIVYNDSRGNVTFTLKIPKILESYEDSADETDR